MICVPLKFQTIFPSTLANNKSETFAEKLTVLGKSLKIADFLEIWLDEIDWRNPDSRQFVKFLAETSLPLIYKIGDTGKIQECLPACVYFDLDFTTSINSILEVKKKFPRAKMILSYHNFQNTPSRTELEAILEKMLDKGGAVFKFACQASTSMDAITMLAFLEYLQSRSLVGICLSMGDQGKITRTAGHLFGNLLSYAPLALDHSTAPGQITAQELRAIYNLSEKSCL